MSFAEIFGRLPLAEWLALSSESGPAQVEAALQNPRRGLADFARLISPAALDLSEKLGSASQRLTQQRFGRVIRLFAPLYLSNECINRCLYCGFSRDNPILRVTLSVDEVVAEARALGHAGFRNILLVAGEHPRFVTGDYLERCLEQLRLEIPSLSLEIGPLDVAAYRRLVAAGAEGLVVYQETYDPEVYAQLHTAGPKKDYGWRLETPERAYAAGFRRLGIGALLGLSEWRREALALAAHCEFLLRNCWRSQLTISLPRLRPSSGAFKPLTVVTDQEYRQLICAFRLVFPDVGIVLSTREPADLRDALVTLGVTMMSAGSHTEPGGYTGAGAGRVHRTRKGKMIELVPPLPEVGNPEEQPGATEQFTIADERSPAAVAEVIRQLGYEPVWKDWDAALATR